MLRTDPRPPELSLLFLHLTCKHHGLLASEAPPNVITSVQIGWHQLERLHIPLMVPRKSVVPAILFNRIRIRKLAGIPHRKYTIGFVHIYVGPRHSPTQDLHLPFRPRREVRFAIDETDGLASRDRLHL